MAFDFTGIDNADFYSGHYLTALLEGDLKSIFQHCPQGLCSPNRSAAISWPAWN
jgi:hypothetical protein